MIAELFGEMRSTTEEENELFDEYLDRISESTDISIFDIIDNEEHINRI